MTNIEPTDSSDDSFGLPEIELKPLSEEDLDSQSQSFSEEEEDVLKPSSPIADFQEPPTENNNNFQSYNDEERSSKSRLMILIAIIGVILFFGGGYLIYNFVWIPSQEKATILKKQKADAERKRLEEEQKADTERKRLEEEQLKAQQAEENLLNEQSQPDGISTIVTLTEPTNRYYVIITSNIDVDLMTDYAKILREKGISTKIIQPAPRKRFYLLAVSDHETLDQAEMVINEIKEKYNQGAWVVNY